MYTISEIASILNTGTGCIKQPGQIEHLLTDSRRLIFPGSTLFFALVTQRRDAHVFIPELYERGVFNFVVEKNFDASGFENANFIFVENPLEALQSLVSCHRLQFHYPVIAITGSNGKTIVKEWLYQLLSPGYRIVRSPRSYNSQIGVPLSVWQMNTGYNLAIFEAGISMPGEMENLRKIIQPDIGILTNIGNAHSENFSSASEKIHEKCRLFHSCKTVIINGDDPATLSILQKHSNAALITWGYNDSNTIQILKLEKKGSQAELKLRYRDEINQLIIPFSDEASVQNIMTCTAVLLYFNIPIEQIRERVQLLQPVDMRLQLIPAVNNCSIINDSYSFDSASFSAALDFMQQQNQFPDKTVIISAMPGNKGKEDYEEIINLLKARRIKKIIAIGDQWKPYLFLAEASIANVLFYYSTDAFLNKFSNNQFRNELILLKGARKFRFETIASLLQQKVHRTVMEINLTAIIHNLNTYRQCLKPGVKIMAMVKASGYGSGSAEIANVLQFHKADYLAVAYADEGADLRKVNIRLPIMVMNMGEGAFETVIQYNLEPEIYSISIFKKFDSFLNKQGLQLYPVHLKIDTGMHRLGFGMNELQELIGLLKSSNRMVIKSVFSHLSASEDPKEDAFTTLQAERLKLACSIIETAIGYPFLKHISNTAAISRKPGLQLDMVRVGIGLFGIDNNLQSDLVPAITLKTTIAQIRDVKSGETVGYNRKGKINMDSVIATLRIGYADGFCRNLSNGKGKVFIHGKTAPVVGTIAMDMSMADVTLIPGIKEDDEVEIFGKNISITEVAVNAGTIPYEILTGIGPRVKRIYIEE